MDCFKPQSAVYPCSVFWYLPFSLPLDPLSFSGALGLTLLSSMETALLFLSGSMQSVGFLFSGPPTALIAFRLYVIAVPVNQVYCFPPSAPIPVSPLRSGCLVISFSSLITSCNPCNVGIFADSNHFRKGFRAECSLAPVPWCTHWSGYPLSLLPLLLTQV